MSQIHLVDRFQERSLPEFRTGCDIPAPNGQIQSPSGGTEKVSAVTCDACNAYVARTLEAGGRVNQADHLVPPGRVDPEFPPPVDVTPPPPEPWT